MRKRVFISSVTAGLHQERTALPGLIRALGMEPVRFEDFTARPDPSREVCLRAVEASDVYLLLLGESYGQPFPDTGLSPTHEEYRVALSTGLPCVAFRRRGVEMEDAQQRLLEEVEAYQTGGFRGSWEEVGELLNAVSEALSDLDALLDRVVFTPVLAPVAVGWLTAPDDRDRFSAYGEATIEVYLSPLETHVAASRLRTAGDVAAGLLREIGGVGQDSAIETAARTDGGVVVRVVRPHERQSMDARVRGGQIEGISAASNGEVCAWASLQRDNFGSVVNRESLTEACTPLVGAAGRLLSELSGEASFAVVPSVAVTGAMSVVLGQPDVVGNRSRATLPMWGESTITLPGAESVGLSALISGARDVATELAERAEHALRNRYPAT